MIDVIVVGIGGFIGTVLRYLLGKVPVTTYFPITTFLINIIGSFAIGFFAELSSKSLINERTALFLKTGLCGGFTTFSAFSLETFRLFEKHKFFTGALYSTLSIICCLFGVYIGIQTARLVKA